MKLLDKIYEHIASKTQGEKVRQMQRLGYEFQALLVDGSIEMKAKNQPTSLHHLIYIDINGEVSQT